MNRQIKKNVHKVFQKFDLFLCSKNVLKEMLMTKSPQCELCVIPPALHSGM